MRRRTESAPIHEATVNLHVPEACSEEDRYLEPGANWTFDKSHGPTDRLASKPHLAVGGTRGGEPPAAHRTARAHRSPRRSATPSAGSRGLRIRARWQPVSDFDGSGRRAFGVRRRTDTAEQPSGDRARGALPRPSLPLQGDDPDEERDDHGSGDGLWKPVGAGDPEDDQARDDHEQREAPSAAETAQPSVAGTSITHGVADPRLVSGRDTTHPQPDASDCGARPTRPRNVRVSLQGG